MFRDAHVLGDLENVYSPAGGDTRVTSSNFGEDAAGQVGAVLCRAVLGQLAVRDSFSADILLDVWNELPVNMEANGKDKLEAALPRAVDLIRFNNEIADT